MLKSNEQSTWRERIRTVLKEAQIASIGTEPSLPPVSDTPAVDTPPVDGLPTDDIAVDSPKVTLTTDVLEKLLIWASQGDDEEDGEGLDDLAGLGGETTDTPAVPTPDLDVLQESKTVNKWSKKNKVVLKESFARPEEKAAWDQGAKAYTEQVIECPPNLGESLSPAWHAGWQSKFVSEQEAPVDLAGGDDTGEEVVDVDGSDVDEDTIINGLDLATVIQRITDAAANAEDGVVTGEMFDTIVADEDDGSADLDSELNDLEKPEETAPPTPEVPPVA